MTSEMPVLLFICFFLGQVSVFFTRTGCLRFPNPVGCSLKINNMNRLFTILALILISSLCQARQEPSTTQELIASMHNTYKGTWYRSLTFTQHTEFFQNGVKQREETWYEAMDMVSGALV